MTTAMAAPHAPTANDRLKEGFAARVWLSLIAATILHVLPLQFWPTMEVESWGPQTASVMHTVPPPPVELPPEPQALSRPLRPALATDDVVMDTYDVPSWSEVLEPPPPPPADAVATSRDLVPFTPHTVAPKLANPARMERVLQREYPPTLRDAGIGGTVHLLVHVDAEGLVTEARVALSSGMGSLDEAALRVADVMRFHPALNLDTRVAVWIRLPVTFQVR